jgi:hypothetical protein
VEYFGIDEIGSNFATEVFNPHGYAASDYVDGILGQCNMATGGLFDPNSAVETQTQAQAHQTAQFNDVFVGGERGSFLLACHLLFYKT